MELHDFLEEDILLFLDRKLIEEGPASERNAPAMRDDEVAAVFLSRDYERELFDALRAHDLSRAKRILHGVKDDFASYPEDSLERRQLKVLLHSLYEKFKEFLDEESTIDHLERAIDESEPQTPSARKVAASSPPAKPSRPDVSLPGSSSPSAPRTPSLQKPVLSSPPKTPEEEKLSAPPPSPPPKASAEGRQSAPLKRFFEEELLLRRALQHRDARAAYAAYAEAKNAFTALDRGSQLQHRERMLQYHKLLLTLTAAPVRPALDQEKRTPSVQWPLSPDPSSSVPRPRSFTPSSASSPVSSPVSPAPSPAPLLPIASAVPPAPVGKQIAHDLPGESELLTYHEKRLTRQRP